jgi:hypothetical protein
VILFLTLSKNDVELNGSTPPHHLGSLPPQFFRLVTISSHQNRDIETSAAHSHTKVIRDPRDLSDRLATAAYIHEFSLRQSIYKRRTTCRSSNLPITTINAPRLPTSIPLLPHHNPSLMSYNMASEEPPRVHSPPSPSTKRPKGTITPRATPPLPPVG